MRVSFLVLIFWSTIGLAFIPAVESSLKQLMKGRKPHSRVEALFRHTISVDSSRQVVIEERILKGPNRMDFSWRTRAGSAERGTYRDKQYQLLSRKTIQSKSGVWVEYLFNNDPDRLRNQLLKEQFVRQGQLVTHGPEYLMQGDPATWEIKKHYKVQKDISLHRLPQGTSERIVGKKNSVDSRVLYFSRELSLPNARKRKIAARGIYRLEWGRSGVTSAWDFKRLQWMSIGGFYPKQWTFLEQSVERVRSNLVSLSSLSVKQYREKQKAWNAFATNPKDPNFNVALEKLLSFR